MQSVPWKEGDPGQGPHCPHSKAPTTLCYKQQQKARGSTGQKPLLQDPGERPWGATGLAGRAPDIQLEGAPPSSSRLPSAIVYSFIIPEPLGTGATAPSSSPARLQGLMGMGQPAPSKGPCLSWGERGTFVSLQIL